VTAEDRLFATVDPTTRKTKLPGGEQILLTDTVGFVKKLPHELVEAFRSTLEVATEVDLLVHVVDGAGPDPDGHIVAVREVLNGVGANEVPELLVFNKADLSPDVEKLVGRYEGAVCVSAATGQGVEELLLAIGDRLRALSTVYEIFVPWSRGDMLAAVHREGEVMTEISEDAGMRLQARLEEASANRLSEFVVSSRAGGQESRS